MEFNETLISISKNDDFERTLLEQMKPHLIEIAKKDHSYGCIVLFKNFKKNFYSTICHIMSKEINTIDNFYLSGISLEGLDADDFVKGYALIWNKQAKANFSTRQNFVYRNISSYILIVTHTENENIFDIKELSKDKKEVIEGLRMYSMEATDDVRYYFTY